MKRWRRFYYDIFSHFYDAIIALHSRDKSASLRDFLLDRSTLAPGQDLLDICTGTGAVALRAAQKLGSEGTAVGVDFSRGMLQRARQKAAAKGIQAHFVQADVADLPFFKETFHVVTCSHAMYELTPETRNAALSEARRVLVPGGIFIMMEHMAPKQPLVRFLYNLRLASMGSSQNREFARDERPFIKPFFKEVKMETAPGGRSKIIRGIKPVQTPL